MLAGAAGKEEASSPFGLGSKNFPSREVSIGIEWSWLKLPWLKKVEIGLPFADRWVWRVLDYHLKLFKLLTGSYVQVMTSSERH